MENASALAPTLLIHAFSNIFAKTKKLELFSFEIPIPGGADTPEKAKKSRAIVPWKAVFRPTQIRCLCAFASVSVKIWFRSGSDPSLFYH